VAGAIDFQAAKQNAVRASRIASEIRTLSSANTKESLEIRGK
jgi:hypothetical protein